ncbi:C1orf50-like protein [Armadillidium nasatum]|uniref:C1orf50-like protein n=1 Tax=Armadillidium nasatum TaxID=96803 RepID=A0A5N5T5F4_9CRUS|nr:C1orf50-like protein [Armadillidium nasatum]
MTSFSEILQVSNEASLVEANTNPSGVQLVNPYRTNKRNSSDLVALAQEIQNADKFVYANVSNKLQVIAEQVRFLQEQAKRVLEEAKNCQTLHHVSCNFVKKPGHIYHLYKRPSGQRYFSMLSPREWGESPPHEFEGSFRLEQDQSWTPVEKLSEKDNDQEMINKILKCTDTLSITIGTDME